MKEIVGYEGLYTIAEDGTIHNSRGKIVKSRVSNRGYHKVNLSNKGEIKTHRVHRLVALTYLPTEDTSLEVYHKDENKSNNHKDNLRWCTGKENIGYYYENNPDKKGKPQPAPLTVDERKLYLKSISKTLVINGIPYPSVTQAAKMICSNEGKQLDTVRKELRKYVQGKRPEWCMYGKYNIGF